MTVVILWVILIGLAFSLFFAIVTGRMPGHGGSAAGLTAFHAFQPKDKQNAIEVIIDENAGKRWEEQENGEGPQPCLRAPGAKIAKEEKL